VGWEEPSLRAPRAWCIYINLCPQRALSTRDKDGMYLEKTYLERKRYLPVKFFEPK